jgi:hypothetical protein
MLPIVGLSGCCFNFITCANAICVCGTTALNSTAITGTTRIAFNVLVIITLSILVRRYDLLSKDLLFGHSLHHLVGGHRKSSDQVCVWPSLTHE